MVKRFVNLKAKIIFILYENHYKPAGDYGGFFFTKYKSTQRSEDENPNFYFIVLFIALGSNHLQCWGQEWKNSLGKQESFLTPFTKFNRI